MRNYCHTSLRAAGRGLYFFGRSGFAKCGMWKVEFGIVVRCGKATAEYTAPLRSALHSNRTFITRGRYLLTVAPAFCSPIL